MAWCVAWRCCVIAMTCVVACGPGRPISVGGTESSAGDGGDDGSGGDDDGGVDHDGAFAEDDGANDDDGGGDVPVNVGSCAGLDPNGPTVAGGEVGPSGFPPACDPTVDGGPVGAYTCCSDDPSAIGGALPDFQGLGTDGGMPYFAGLNNWLGRWGACVRTADIPVGNALEESAAQGCPTPCDPAWGTAEVDAVCGAGFSCCQTQELRPEDCIFDEASGMWRAVEGTDIGVKSSSGTSITNWAPGEHATHQDPNGIACMQIADGNLGSDVFRDCVRNLHVANHRGFCLPASEGQLCPLADGSYIDACEAMNAG